MLFNGSDDFIESLDLSDLAANPSFSIEARVRLAGGGPAGLWGPILQWGQGGAGKEVYFSIQNDNNDHLYAGFYNAGQWTPNAVPTDQWIHVVWTRAGNNDSATGTTLYVDGAEVPLAQDPDLNPGFLPEASINVEKTAFRINRGQDFVGTRRFTGALDELAVYDRVLTPTEVSDLHAAVPEPVLTGGVLLMGCLLRRRRR